MRDPMLGRAERALVMLSTRLCPSSNMHFKARDRAMISVDSTVVASTILFCSIKRLVLWSSVRDNAGSTLVQPLTSSAYSRHRICAGGLTIAGINIAH